MPRHSAPPWDNIVVIVNQTDHFSDSHGNETGTLMEDEAKNKDPEKGQWGKNDVVNILEAENPTEALKDEQWKRRDKADMIVIYGHGDQAEQYTGVGTWSDKQLEALPTTWFHGIPRRARGSLFCVRAASRRQAKGLCYVWLRRPGMKSACPGDTHGVYSDKDGVYSVGIRPKDNTRYYYKSGRSRYPSYAQKRK